MDADAKRLDDAARAGWLYYVVGNTQEEIAAKLGISRQSAQRLVSLAMSEGLIRVRLEHPIAACLNLARELKSAFNLELAEVVPTDPSSNSTTVGVAQAGAAEIERFLSRPEPSIMGIGTGRTLKAAIDQIKKMDASQHSVVSLTGNIGPDGSAAYYNVIYGMANFVNARLYAMPLPVIASSAEERASLHQLPLLKKTLALAARAQCTFVGIGDMGEHAPLIVDGFIKAADLKALQKAGAIGEICGWVYDAEGHIIDGLTNARVASAPIPSRKSSLVVAIAKGPVKLPGIRAAIRHRLVNGLITDEQTASEMLRHL